MQCCVECIVMGLSVRMASKAAENVLCTASVWQGVNICKCSEV